MDSGSCVVINQEPVEIQLNYQICPFKICLKEASEERKQTMDSGVDCLITCQRSYWFAHYWGVDITKFHEAMQLDWTAIKSAMLQGSLFTDVVSKSEPEL